MAQNLSINIFSNKTNIENLNIVALLVTNCLDISTQPTHFLSKFGSFKFMNNFYDNTFSQNKMEMEIKLNQFDILIIIDQSTKKTETSLGRKSYIFHNKKCSYQEYKKKSKSNENYKKYKSHGRKYQSK